jgi:hypothetical protein
VRNSSGGVGRRGGGQRGIRFHLVGTIITPCPRRFTVWREGAQRQDFRPRENFGAGCGRRGVQEGFAETLLPSTRGAAVGPRWRDCGAKTSTTPATVASGPTTVRSARWIRRGRETTPPKRREGNGSCPLSGAGVARRGVEVDWLTLGELPGDGVLTAANRDKIFMEQRRCGIQ